MNLNSEIFSANRTNGRYAVTAVRGDRAFAVGAAPGRGSEYRSARSPAPHTELSTCSYIFDFYGKYQHTSTVQSVQHHKAWIRCWRTALPVDGNCAYSLAVTTRIIAEPLRMASRVLFSNPHGADIATW